jgi:ASPIC/UnbV protein
LHFGLGTSRQANLEVQWPSGSKEVIPDVAADQWIVIREGAGLVKTTRFSAPPALFGGSGDGSAIGNRPRTEAK